MNSALAILQRGMGVPPVHLFLFTAILSLLAFPLIASAETQPTTRRSDEIRRGMEMGGSPQERAQKFYSDLVHKVEPDGAGDVKKLSVYLEFFSKEFIHDSRQFAVSLHATGNVVTGFVETPEHQQALAEFLNYLKLNDVGRNVEVLPSNQLGEKKFAIVTADRCFLYDRPTGRSESLTECTRGDCVWLLKDQSERILCHGPGGYVGWIESANIRRVGDDELDAALNAKPIDDRVEKVIAAAREYLGTKYVWGGLSKDGIDCSGLVQKAFQSVGIILPRDSDQQALAGRLIAVRWHRSSMRRGDLMYFIGHRGAITHTAIYLGDNDFLEAADGGVKISSLNPLSPNFEKKRDAGFRFAKRVLQ